ncbi:Piwi-domain-containing protein [Mollisia scopiformis]|uniref:Piwi-domain-containing protein n=1 Tax=Mollisia scopiformis TaxID=149040 RepID=A0A194XMJ6_MOLSC|nr:Piwi-domain-containing protein [Mollisia scopiformis]KUJ21351.1 Piwi-domain-containing protein [Mollisia scopiformis]
MHRGGTIPVHFFGAVGYGYKSPLINIHGTGKSGAFTQTDYLAQVLKPYIQDFLAAFAAVLGPGKTPQFMEDGNSAHGHKTTSNICATWRTSMGITLFPHPAVSPDMNPIEKCWRRIKQALHRRLRQPTTEVQMVVAVLEEWDKIPQEWINGLIEQQDFWAFGLKVANDFLAVKGKTLRYPDVRYGSQTQNTDPSWNLKSHPKFLTKGGDWQNLVVVEVGSFTEHGLIRTFLAHLVSELAFYEIPISGDFKLRVDPLVDRDSVVRRAHYSVAFQEIFDDVLRQAHTNPVMFLFILADKDATVYADIKWWADCIRGVPSICVTSTAVQKAVGKRPKPTDRDLRLANNKNILDCKVYGNLALKINFKLGGVNHRLAGTSGVKLNTMLVGADVTHSGKGADPGCPSLAGVVSSCSSSIGKFVASARLQSNNTEYIEDLEGMMLERLQWYQSKNENKLPDHILFYRDGVSESQYGMVRDEELPQIQEACRKIQAGRTPRSIQITLLVVGKRHHTRFFPKGRESPENLKAGLCVETEVMPLHQFSFYLQSHQSALGTARSGHYVVIENESRYTATLLQETTNNLCYIGSRATAALSICTPARYADILCDRLRCYMRPVFEGELLNFLKNNPIADYRDKNLIWGTGNGRVSPWHPNLNDRSFYL